ncbi:MAG TPA: sigma-54 dependent transcriptional regulator [Steroidobacteraceae bacterium]|jgi:DNA-binding NtrC family response regulator|nr:sigma-54 dependent transcriptional regulator [Steroidobacteraceae bacterium]
MPHALIVDDDPDMVAWLQEVARLEGFTSTGVQTLQAAREQLSRKRPDVVLTDLRLPDGQGIELARELPAGDAPELIVVTGHASVDSAIAALRAGATDYLVKPAELDRVQAVLRHARKTAALRNEIGALRHELRRLGRFGRLMGSAPAMELLYDQMARVAPTSATVLLLGESGTGKELAALTLHELSRRREAPFLPLNCGAVSPQLIESELFGHERGSFTGADRQHKGFFERAHGGTVFLDEVTEMPMELQVKLLRVLETGSFSRVGGVTPIVCDVRIIAASNREPELALADGKLREDLYHRLNVFPIRLPPLRQRGADIELLARHFLAELNRTEGTTKTFTSDSLASLYQHSWPGNVRELRNHVQRAFIMADDVIDSGLPAGVAAAASDDGTTVTIRVGTPLEEVERRVTLATLAQCGHVKRKAADILGVSLKTLYNRLEVYNGRNGAEPAVADAGEADVARPAAAQRPPDEDRWS